MNPRSSRLTRGRCRVTPCCLALVIAFAFHGGLHAAAAQEGAKQASAPPGSVPKATMRATIVVSGDGKPLDQAEVTLDHDRKEAKTLYTGKNGEASVIFDAKRKVKVRVIAKGDWETTFTEVQLADGAREEIKIKARAKP